MEIRCVIFGAANTATGGPVLCRLAILAMVTCDVSRGKGAFSACFPHAYGVWHAWTDFAVIRIRYKDFSAGTHEVAGLHGRVERCPSGATVCLLPGLTARQRRGGGRGGRGGSARRCRSRSWRSRSYLTG